VTTPLRVGQVMMWNGSLWVNGDHETPLAVTLFGAEGDGETDDSDAIQSAIDASDDSGRIVLPPGTYIATGLTLDAGKTLEGPGVLKWKAAATQSLLVISGTRTCLSGLTIDGNQANQTSDVINAIETDAAPYCRIRNVDFQNFRFKVIRVDVADSPNGLIEHCTFTNIGSTAGGNGIEIRSPRWRCEDLRFDGVGASHCIRLGLYNADDDSVPVYGCIVTGCKFTDIVTPGGAILCELFTQHAVISHNEIDNANGAFKVESAGDQFDILIVNNNVRDLGSGLNINAVNVTLSNNRFLRMAGRVDLGNGAICVGNYFEDCGAVASGDDLIAAVGGATNITISGNNILDILGGARCIAIAGDTIVSGNVIDGVPSDAAIRVEGAGNVVTGNVIRNAETAVHLASGVEETVITENVFADITSTVITGISTTAAGWATTLIKDNVGWGGVLTALTIASGVVAIGPSTLAATVDTQSAAATDDLDTISGGYIGQVITLRSVDAARDVVLKNGTGNLAIKGDITLHNTTDVVALQYDGTNWNDLRPQPSPGSVTIASGAVTITGGALVSLLSVDTESAAATDDLDTISGGTAGQVIILKSVTGTRVPTVKDNTGNIQLDGSADFALSTSLSSLMLVYTGSNWIECGGRVTG
jgi:hypothetical protein